MRSCQMLKAKIALIENSERRQVQVSQIIRIIWYPTYTNYIGERDQRKWIHDKFNQEDSSSSDGDEGG